MLEFLLNEDDYQFLSVIENNIIFLNLMLPNNINIFQLNEIDEHVFNYIKKFYKTMQLLIYPVYKHLWINSNLYYIFDENLNSDVIICSETPLPNYRFFNLKALDLQELKDSLYNIEYKNKRIYLNEYILSLEAYSFLYVQLVQKIKFKDFSFYFVLGIVEACIKIGCCSIPFKQNKHVENKYKLKPGKIELKSLLISNQTRIFDIWKKEEDVLITGGTGTGKTSQIPKLFWWINMWLDGLEIDYNSFDYNKLKKTSIIKRSTTLSLPRKVLISSNSKFAAKSLGYDRIRHSPINCKFKDVKQTEFYNPNVYDFLSPFIFSINRSTTFVNVSTIIFDEIHEHDTYCDIGIAIIKKIKKDYNIRNLVLITATVTNDLDNLKKTFPKMIEMKIKDEYLFPIQEIDLSKMCNVNNNYSHLEDIIQKYSLKKNQSTLIFLPSLSSIEKLANRLKYLPKLYTIIKLHRKAVLENPSLVSNISNFTDNHVIILSTPIAESSITIDTAKVVIDSGLFFSKEFFSGKITYITESMMQQRKGRVGRVSSGIYIHLFPLDKINMNFKKIDYEFLLPYIISFKVYGMDYEDFFIKPDIKRYNKTIEYYNKRGIDFQQRPLYINRIYNQYPCSIGEYLIIYLYGTDQEKKILKKFDNMDEEDSMKFIEKHFNIFKSISKKLNLVVVPTYTTKYYIKVNFKKYFEKMLPFTVNIFLKQRSDLYLLKENIALALK